MKVLMIAYEFPPVGGGMGKAVFYTAREFVNMGHKVSVLTLRFKEQAAKELVNGIQVFRIPALRRRLHQSNPMEIATFSLSGIIHAGKISDMFKPDLAMAYFTIPSGVISLWLKWTRDIPFVTLLRGQDVPGWLPETLRYYHAFCKPLIRFILQKSEQVIANSKGLAEMAKNTILEKHIFSISNAVDTERYFPICDRKKENRISIFFAGRLRFQKGLCYLIQGISMIKHNKTKRRGEQPFCLKIAGSGPQENFLKKLVKQEGVEKEVIFLSYLNEPDLIKVYQNSDIFVNPSLNEGMPNSVLESMACGLPCVVTDVEGNNELVRDGENGFLVRPKDALALANALQNLIEDAPLRERMGSRSREIVVQNFTYKITANKLIGLMEKGGIQ